jgi:flavin reductase (DIM6/NTAB) family NADH-FMN oxidoreductase RutF
LVGISLENDAHSLANIRANKRFTVNLLAEGEAGRKLAARFAQPFEDGKVLGRRHDGKHPFHAKLDGVAYTPTEHGAPILDGALSWIECEAVEFFPVGDHTLVAATVLTGAVLYEADPLTSTYTGWNYSG